MAYQFLSDDWLAEVKKIGDEYGAEDAGADLTLNVLVTSGPDGDRELHLANGVIGSGLVDGAPTTITVPYEVAKSMFVSGDQQAAMQAFMSGQITVQGDMTKLMAMQGGAGGGSGRSSELQQRLKEITVL